MNRMFITFIGVAGFLIFCWWLAIIYGKNTKDADDFLVAGRNVGFWILVGSWIGSAFGGATIAGFAGYAYANGLNNYMTILPNFIFLIIVVFIYSKRLSILGSKYHLVSIPDFLALRFGNKVRVPAVIFVFFRMGFVTGLQILATGLVFQTGFGIDLKVGMAIGAFALIGYVVIGGAMGSVVVEWFQSLLQSGMMILLCIIAMYMVGQGNIFGALKIAQETMEPAYFDIFHLPSNQILNYFLVSGVYYFADQWVFGRVFSAKDPDTAFKCLTLGNFFCIFFGVLPFICGIMLRIGAINGTIPIPDTVAASNVFFYFAIEILPMGIGVFFLVAYLAAILSCGSTFILGGAAVATKDIYKTFINKNANSKQMLRASRVSTLVVAAIGTIGALWIPNLVVLFNMGNCLTACGLLVPVLSAFFWRRATTKAAVLTCWIGGLTGLGTAIYSTVAAGTVAFTPSGIPVMLIGICVSAVVMIVVSLLDKPDQDEKIDLTAYNKLAAK